MKLRTKLAIFAAALCALSIAGCSLVLLLSANKSAVTSAIDAAVAEQQMLTRSFENGLTNTYEKTLSDTAETSLAKYLFRRYAASTLAQSAYAMRQDGVYLYNGGEIDPAKVLEFDAVSVLENDSETARYIIVENGGERFLVVGASSVQNERTYDIYLIKSIEQVYRDNASLTFRVAAIGLFMALACAIVLALFVFKTLRPLKTLGKSAAALAGGDYQSRISIKGDDEIAALSKSFNSMAEAVQAHINEINDVSEARKLLLAALTHELKTPMTAIIGYSEALQRTKLTPEQRDEAIAYINSECRRIERLTQKLMGLITLDGGEALHLMPVPALTLLSSVEKTLQSAAEQSGIKLTAEADECEINMDADLMASVLINLFDNARKAKAKHIMLCVKNSVITVTDDGVGIPKEELKRITEPFYMVDKSRSRKAGGVGLGLALVSRIVSLHGARLTIFSEVGLGTSMEITF
ncbi:MAG: HAMP domain-containing sensor histidine kinase [Christensenella sp.]